MIPSYFEGIPAIIQLAQIGQMNGLPWRHEIGISHGKDGLHPRVTRFLEQDQNLLEVIRIHESKAPHIRLSTAVCRVHALSKRLPPYLEPTVGLLEDTFLAPFVDLAAAGWVSVRMLRAPVFRRIVQTGVAA